MKPYLVLWTETALQKLTELLDWLAERSPATATKAQKRIMDKVGMLAEFPRMAPPFRLIPDPDVRQLTVDRYRVIYRVRDEKSVVIILAVQHGREDPSTALEESDD
jgi:toxin ParE1/3/4